MMALANIGGTKIPGLSYPVLNQSSEFYITSDFLDDYVEVMGLDSAWPIGVQAEEVKKEAAVFRSQIYIESLYYHGNQFWSYQLLQWPRYPVYDKGGLLVDSHQTPYDIFNAVAEGAYQEYKNPNVLQGTDTDDEIYPLQSSEATAGSVSTKKAYDTANKKAKSSAERLSRLQEYLRHWRASTGTFVSIART